MIGTMERLDAPLPEPAPDVLLVHEAAGAGEPPAGPATVWIGQAPPEWALASVGDDESLGDRLPSAITKALIARRAR